MTLLKLKKKNRLKIQKLNSSNTLFEADTGKVSKIRTDNPKSSQTGKSVDRTDGKTRSQISSVKISSRALIQNPNK